MNRRSFLTKLAGAFVATKLAFELGAKAVEAKIQEVTCRINPAWVDATYEATYMMDRDKYHEMALKWVPDPNALRFEFVNGQYIPVPKYIVQ